MKYSFVAAIATLCAAAGANAATVGVDTSSASWLGFMNVFNLDNTYVFGSSWGITDLCANFNDAAHTLTLSPNTIGDPNPFWYIGGGGPGAPGNKIMDAALYQETTGVYTGQTLTFQGNVLSNTLTQAHQSWAFIRDFAADYSSVVETHVLLTPGAFSITQNLINDPSRHVQWGFETRGVDVWATDVGPFGSVVVGTVPAPASLAMIGLASMAASRRRR